MSKVLEGVIVALIVSLNIVGYVIYTGMDLNTVYFKRYINYISMTAELVSNWHYSTLLLHSFLDSSPQSSKEEPRVMCLVMTQEQGTKNHS